MTASACTGARSGRGAYDEGPGTATGRFPAPRYEQHAEAGTEGRHRAAGSYAVPRRLTPDRR
ncbi:hypothetical protein S1361_04970 [Streptomyces cyanogenus]|uniref:Uncharacterized protein n=1 Tax=Streptomyces cyanogenus TaxID=80860 RepID=A0ABX7TMW0_STRCY|nr:hypothetical protein S1361_04970 [Streptomyces cyanogenus]